MSRHKKDRYFKEIQIFDESIMLTDNKEIRDCYEHFKLRYIERYSKSKDTGLCYESYWSIWIHFLRGNLAYIYEDQMIRVLGNYIKDPSLYKVVYKKVKKLNIYVPLTIYEITDHKKRFHLYKKVLKHKENIKK
jgi:hypothetical protein